MNIKEAIEYAKDKFYQLKIKPSDGYCNSEQIKSSNGWVHQVNICLDTRFSPKYTINICSFRPPALCGSTPHKVYTMEIE